MHNFVIAHSGVKRKSGRYPWGSGEHPYQHEWWFTWGEKEMGLREKGLSDQEIAKMMGLKLTELKSLRSVTNEKAKAAARAEAYRLKQKGMSNIEIAKRLDGTEGTIRNYLSTNQKIKEEKIQGTVDILKKHINENSFLDVGAGVEVELGVTETKKNAAVAQLVQEGYTRHYIAVEQQNNPGYYTYLKVLAPPGTTYSDVNKHREKIHILNEHTTDNGKTWLDIYPPKNIDSKRVFIRYGDDGGKEKDGVIELRRGVEDISLGDSRYAQVRIAVDGTHYLKGMALYSDNIPDGYDIVYNTNKSSSVPKKDVFKPQNTDKDGNVDLKDPFSAVLRANGQRHYIGADGKEHLSAINIVNQEGDWENYKKHISSQMLSKQDLSVARRQLTLEKEKYQRDYDEIMAVTNPEVRQKLLKTFADDCDAASIHLKAAAFPRQAARVILPLTNIKEDEVYAPGYKHGEKVVLIRHPHGGKFEIPELTVNNRNKDGIATISNQSIDSIGIHAKVAERLSGADFDGDTVLVIPNNSGKIKTSKPLEELKNFDPHESYPAYPGMPRVSDTNFDTQRQMGEISNLITDMTLKGAKSSEIARAVRHSMVVIDAKKHNLDWKTSFEDNNIAQLKRDYQGGANRGASTLISKAKSEMRVPERDKMYVKWDPETGEKLYRETGKTHIDKRTGKEVPNTTKITKMEYYKDARALSSGTAMEELYADYANTMKSLANTARLSYLRTTPSKQNASAKETYAKELASINSKLNVALKNAPITRKAQMVAEMVVKAKIEANPDLKLKENKKELRKLRSRALAAASARYGSTRKENSINLTEKEWEAIQAGAVSSSKLKKILEYTDIDVVRKYATPKSRPAMSTSNVAAARAMLNSGYTQAEVAERFGVSVSTLIDYVKG